MTACVDCPLAGSDVACIVLREGHARYCLLQRESADYRRHVVERSRSWRGTAGRPPQLPPLIPDGPIPRNPCCG